MKTPSTQKGIALLVMMIVIILAATSYFVSGVSVNEVKADRIKQIGGQDTFYVLIQMTMALQKAVVMVLRQ